MRPRYRSKNIRHLMTSCNQSSWTLNFAFGPAVAILLWLVAGCSKPPAPETAASLENSAAASSESVPETIAPVPPTSVAATISQSPESAEGIEAEVTNYVADLNAGETPVVEGLIHEITSSERTPREKAEGLFAMLPRLEQDGQRKVALVALRQVGDADYEVVLQHLFNAALDPQVLSVFMTDMLKRKSSIKLPTLLELARVDGHPLHQESGAMLRALLKTDQGTNWTRWERVVEMRLASEAN
jgi:hypothetical protein